MVIDDGDLKKKKEKRQNIYLYEWENRMAEIKKFLYSSTCRVIKIFLQSDISKTEEIKFFKARFRNDSGCQLQRKKNKTPNV